MISRAEAASVFQSGPRTLNSIGKPPPRDGLKPPWEMSWSTTRPPGIEFAYWRTTPMNSCCVSGRPSSGSRGRWPGSFMLTKALPELTSLPPKPPMEPAKSVTSGREMRNFSIWLK